MERLGCGRHRKKCDERNIFLGFCAGFPWYDPKMLDPKRQSTLAEAGFNVVRLGAMWTGVQPEQGGDQVNQTYVDILKVEKQIQTLCSYQLILLRHQKKHIFA